MSDTNTALRRFGDCVRAVREATDTFDRSGGYSRGHISRQNRTALDVEISKLVPAMLAVRLDDKRRAAAAKAAAVPDYKEIACIFGTALGTALTSASGNGFVGTKRHGEQVDTALREIFKIEVDKPAE